MFVTPLNFSQVLGRFYNQSEYDFLLLFVSSFDGKDKTIIQEIVDNAKRIDRITGDRICFFYFIKDAYDDMNESLTRWVKKISDWTPLYGEGVSVTMETADDICSHFGIMRTNLPAFILIRNNRREEPQIFTVRDYNDFERFLTPLNILHSYIEDRRYVISRYERERRRGVVTEEQVKKRDEQRRAWTIALERQERKKGKELSLGLSNKAAERETEIQRFKDKLSANPALQPQGEDESVIYPHQQLDLIKGKDIENLNISLNSNEGGRLVDYIEEGRYSETVIRIWDLVRTRSSRISRIIENMRYEIHERGFDVFISCKSQDYVLAHELYDYLVCYGFKPFLADTSIKEVGIDQYTALIGEVINVCQNMIVFATDLDYVETPYMAAEWHTFVNDINTGHKPYAKLVNILAPNIDIHALPAWLRDKQCFTTENYKEDILQFLKGDQKSILRLRKKVDEVYGEYRHLLKRINIDAYDGSEQAVHDFIYKLERDKEKLDWLLDRLDRSNDSSADSIVKHIKIEIDDTLGRWKNEYHQAVKFLEQQGERQERCSREISQNPSFRNCPKCGYTIPSPVQRCCPCCGYVFYRKGTSAPTQDTLPSPKPKCAAPNYTSRQEVSCPNIEVADKESWFGRFTRVIKSRWASKKKKGITYELAKMNNQDSSLVYSSIFAPAEVKRKSHMLIQVYLHLFEETENVKALAQESDKKAERRDYIPLQCKLKKGDKVDVLLNIYGETLLMLDKKSVVWQGSFTKCSFDYFVPKDIDVNELSCVAMLTVNGVPVGEMRFITQIVDSPRQLNPEILAHKYNKVFISYSHQDESKVKFLHEGLELGSVPHFFDRKYLKTGDVFPQVIQDYINSADLFILCWSENASKSEYVQKERLQALERAFPHVKPEQEAKLRIYPMSIEPRAELPGDMKNYYHFGEM